MTAIPLPQKHRVLVIGLDSATLDLIRPWAEAGELPHLERLLREGVSGPLRSTVPAISPPAWVSFMTGQYPGKHGVFDFLERHPNSYHLQFVRLDLPRLNTLFGRLSSAGRRVGVMGVPLTYPPEPVNGFMIAGPWSPIDPSCVFPSEMFGWLQARGYEINNTQAYSPERAAEFAAYLEKTTATRADVALDLLRREAWDLFMTVFRDTDTVMTFYWHDMDPQHPLHDPMRAARFGRVIKDHHRQLDHYIGEMLQAVDADTSVVIMSDHGGGPLVAEISINKWLMDQGWLVLRNRKSWADLYRTVLRRLGITRSGLVKRLGKPLVSRLSRLLPGWAETLVPWAHIGLIDQVDWTRTKAYSFGGMGQIRINLQGREPGGIVAPGEEYETLLTEMMTRLQHIPDPYTGQPVKVDLRRREALYHGPNAERGADLNVTFDDLRYVTHATFDSIRSGLFNVSADHETGTHRQEGMFIGWGPVFRRSATINANIVDLMPTLLHILHEPIPAGLDGRVLTEALTAEFLAAYPVEHQDSTTLVAETADSPGWTADEEAKILQHLRDLGYLG